MVRTIVLCVKNEVENNSNANIKIKDGQKAINLILYVDAPIAQSVEQLPFKQMVAGSNPAGGTEISRRIFLSLEYGIKYLYAKVISYATKAKFGEENNTISAIVCKNKISTCDKEIISAEHYQPFTKKLLAEFNYAYEHKLEYIVYDIAGNDSIAFVYKDPTGYAIPDNTKEILRDNKNRITVETKVENLFNVYKALKNKNINIEHFYDY